MTEVNITHPGVAAPKSIRIIMKNGHPSMANNKKVRAWMDEVRGQHMALSLHQRVFQ